MFQCYVVCVGAFLLAAMVSPILAEVSPVFIAKDYNSLLAMEDFNSQAMQLHLQLYQGYVKKTNEYLALLDHPTQAEHPSWLPELRRRLMWEYNGMRLHEEYFDNLTVFPIPLQQDAPFYQELTKQFGSFEAWQTQFKEIGKLRGIGWVILLLDPVSQRLENVWIDEHDRGHLAGGIPLLVMDVFEHAYMLQWGLDRDLYITTFFDHINWEVVERRRAHAH